MRTFPIVAIMAAALTAVAVSARAQATPCCDVFDPCEGGEVVRGATPADAGCLMPDGDDADTEPDFVAVPNAGWRCRSDLAETVTATPAGQAVAGCVPGASSCIGGAIIVGGVDGCAWMVDRGAVGQTIVDDAKACTANSVAVCCRYGACI